MGSLEVLRYCDQHELLRLALIFEERSVAEHEVLCREGEQGDEVYIVTAGYLGVVMEERLIATLASGTVAGELAPLGARGRSADLVALTDGEVLVASADQLRRMLSESAGLRRAVTPLLADRVDENERRHAQAV